MLRNLVAPTSRAVDLKNRLSWGEPALTILDLRDRTAYNQSRILGALSVSMEGLVAFAQANLEPTRDIYVYGATDEESAAAAAALRDADFVSVSELQGGLPAWQASGYEVEGYPVSCLS